MSSESPKRLLNVQFAAVARALGHEHRLEMLEHLAQGEHTVESLAEKTGLAFANVSQHLQHMRRSGLVASRREWKNVYYRLAGGPVVEAVAAIRGIAERNIAEVREVVGAYFTNLDAMDPVSSDELAQRLRDGSAVLLDVRPEDEYRQGHLPGAVNLSLDVLETRLAELPADREIVAYCRGPYCVLSFKAVKLLRERGLKARRLRDGLPEWKAAGREVVIEGGDISPEADVNG